ncbi:MAG: YIP1 family protein, partial [Mariprofundaceae bacterium]
ENAVIIGFFLTEEMNMPRYFTTQAIGSSLFSSIGSVVLKPKLFFEGLEQTDNYRNSILFLLLLFSVPALIDGYLIDSQHLAIMFPVMEGVALLLVWLWAGYLYWCIKLFTDHALDHSSAFQLATYCSIPLFLDISLILFTPAFIWQLYLTRHGLILHTGVERSSATMIMVVPIIMFIAIFIAAIIMMALMGIDVVTPYLQ